MTRLPAPGPAAFAPLCRPCSTLLCTHIRQLPLFPPCYARSLPRTLCLSRRSHISFGAQVLPLRPCSPRHHVTCPSAQWATHRGWREVGSTRGGAAANTALHQLPCWEAAPQPIKGTLPTSTARGATCVK